MGLGFDLGFLLHATLQLWLSARDLSTFICLADEWPGPLLPTVVRDK